MRSIIGSIWSSEEALDLFIWEYAMNLYELLEYTMDLYELLYDAI
jgi:hypothetical protein